MISLYQRHAALRIPKNFVDKSLLLLPCHRHRCQRQIRNLTTASKMADKSSEQPTAGIIIIGDEILKGQTLDTNTQFFATNLLDKGIQLKRVVVIPDEIDVIANEVKLFSDNYTFVLTSGGVGPTHDDLTFEGVAKAFDDTTYIHPEIRELLTNYFKEVNDATLKLAKVKKILIFERLMNRIIAMANRNLRF